MLQHLALIIAQDAELNRHAGPIIVEQLLAMRHHSWKQRYSAPPAVAAGTKAAKEMNPDKALYLCE